MNNTQDVFTFGQDVQPAPRESAQSKHFAKVESEIADLRDQLSAAIKRIAVLEAHKARCESDGK